jgi:hypothetical protein
MKLIISLVALCLVVDIITAAELGPICPEAVKCSENLSCIEGFKILTHNENCCCVKMDVAESSEAEESPEVAPICPEAVKCSKNLSCIEGFKILTHNENCCCVKMDVADSPEIDDAPVLLPECPEAEVCPANPICGDGFDIFSLGGSCCCVKEDVYKDADDDGYADIKVCPMCAQEEAGNSDCECIMPLTKFTSTIDSSLHCCQQELV